MASLRLCTLVAIYRVSSLEQRLQSHRWVAKQGNPIPKSTIITKRPGVFAYESSDVELKWLSGNISGRICAFAKEAAITKATEKWISYSTQKSVWAPDNHPVKLPTGSQKSVLSHFVLESNNTRFESHIEPLHGVARYPFQRWCAKTSHGRFGNLFDLSYLIIHNDCFWQQNLSRPKPRVVLFDLGASQGFNRIPGGIPQEVRRGGGITPSMPLLYRLYQDRCLEPDDIFGWELNKRISPLEWWGDAGPALRRKVRFFEVPVDEGTLTKALSGVRNPNSFLQMLEAEVVHTDYVILKLDIDTPVIEQTIIETLTRRPSLASLIDELFFEYHFYFDGINFGWGRKVYGDVDSALATMHRLRALGIRSHFWI